MSRIGVYTDDFMFYHKVIKLLKKWDLPFTSITAGMEVPEGIKLILSSESDADLFPGQVKGVEPINALRRGLSRVLDKSQFSRITIGIDPGPKPGIAVFGDNILMEAFEITEPEKVSGQISRILEDYSYRDSIVRIGHGDIPNRQIIEEDLKKSGIVSQIVDESNTSIPHNLHNNALSAARIALNHIPHTEQSVRGTKRKELFDLEFTTLKRIIN